MSVLEIRDLRWALCARLFDALALQMLNVVVGWQVYEFTRDPLYLACIGLALGIPYISVALWAGQVVDRREKRSIVLAAEAACFASAATLAALSSSHRISLPAIYGCLAVVGFCRSYQFPALVTYIQFVVPKESYPKAAAWQTGVFQAATIAGPLLGGVLYGAFGAFAAYATIACCLLGAVAAAGRMGRVEALAVQDRGERNSRIDQFLSGVRFTLEQPVIFAAMSLDMIGVLFAGVDGVLPIFAARLSVGPIGFGALQAAPAVGALASSLYLTRHQPFRRKGTAFLTALATFGACLVLFGISKIFVVSLLLLAISGIADGTSMVLRSSLYQEITPEHLRGRVAAVNGIFIRASNQLGYFESGLAAKLLGLVPSVVVGGSITLATVAVALFRAPALRRYER